MLFSHSLVCFLNQNNKRTCSANHGNSFKAKQFVNKACLKFWQEEGEQWLSNYWFNITTRLGKIAVSWKWEMRRHHECFVVNLKCRVHSICYMKHFQRSTSHFPQNNLKVYSGTIRTSQEVSNKMIFVEVLHIIRVTEYTEYVMWSELTTLTALRDWILSQWQWCLMTAFGINPVTDHHLYLSVWCW